jgi:hypothetical protein
LNFKVVKTANISKKFSFYKCFKASITILTSLFILRRCSIKIDVKQFGPCAVGDRGLRAGFNGMREAPTGSELLSLSL